MGAITPEMQYLADSLEDLEPSSKLGGIYAFKPGYHSTRADNQANWPGNYSIVDAVDKKGPSDKAGAIDWTFPDAQSGRYETIMKYSSRLLASGKDPDDHRLDGWREFYGQCDADTRVEGYDFRYGQTATSDPSHLWHIHLSCDRDKVTSRANMDNLLSVLRGEPNMTTMGIIGLKKGDKGEPVKGLQALLEYTGFLADGHVTGTYDSATATALVKLRQSVGSSDTVGDEVTGYAYAQIFKVVAQTLGKPGPKGDKGDPGAAGKEGPKGDAAVLAAGATLTVT